MCKLYICLVEDITFAFESRENPWFKMAKSGHLKTTEMTDFPNFESQTVGL